MPTYRLDIAYDGGPFHGYAKQPGLRTVQGDLETALAPYIDGARTVVAGRTDKGVHATEQVVSFTIERELDTARVVRSLNGQLAPSIAARSLDVVDDDFSARFSATGRAYRYRILNAPIHDPMSAGTTWTVNEPLDVAAMHESIQCIVGQQDFSAFCRAQEGRSMVREVLWAAWRRHGELVELSIGARSFCHQMVRSIVAVSVPVGTGEFHVGETIDILESRDRAIAMGACPPQGLVLVAVAYDEEPLPRPGWIPETS